MAIATLGGAPRPPKPAPRHVHRSHALNHPPPHLTGYHLLISHALTLALVPLAAMGVVSPRR